MIRNLGTVTEETRGGQPGSPEASFYDLGASR